MYLAGWWKMGGTDFRNLVTVVREPKGQIWLWFLSSSCVDWTKQTALPLGISLTLKHVSISCRLAWNLFLWPHWSWPGKAIVGVSLYNSYALQKWILFIFYLNYSLGTNFLNINYPRLDWRYIYFIRCFSFKAIIFKFIMNFN